jgi:hypothetical protein
MQQHKMKHAEAFCLMTYRCSSCQKEEELWNSRDGVTPYVIDCRYCKGEATHVNFGSDKFLPNYKPFKGQRIFIDMSEKRKKKIAEKRFTQSQGTPYAIPIEDKKEFIKDFISSFHDGEPDIKTI